MSESSYVLKLQEELKQLLEERSKIREHLRSTHPTKRKYDLNFDLKVNKWKLEDTRKGIRASRMRDRRKRERAEQTKQ